LGNLQLESILQVHDRKDQTLLKKERETITIPAKIAMANIELMNCSFEFVDVVFMVLRFKFL
jgi:hypothetical protein